MRPCVRCDGLQGRMFEGGRKEGGKTWFVQMHQQLKILFLSVYVFAREGSRPLDQSHREERPGQQQQPPQVHELLHGPPLSMPYDGPDPHIVSHNSFLVYIKNEN